MPCLDIHDLRQLLRKGDEGRLSEVAKASAAGSAGRMLAQQPTGQAASHKWAPRCSLEEVIRRQMSEKYIRLHVSRVGARFVLIRYAAPHVSARGCAIRASHRLARYQDQDRVGRQGVSAVGVSRIWSLGGWIHNYMALVLEAKPERLVIGVATRKAGRSCDEWSHAGGPTIAVPQLHM